MSSNHESKQKRSNRLTVLALAVVFLLPVSGAYLAFFGLGDDHSATTNHGDLISPPALIDEFNIRVGEEQFDSASMKRKWWLVYLNDQAECEAQCDEAVQMMRQVHIALGKNAERLARMLINQHASSTAYEQDGLDVVYAHFEQGVIKAKVNNPELRGELHSNRLYLVDPRGFVILQYDPKAHDKSKELYFKGVLKDIKKLMKFSRIG